MTGLAKGKIESEHQTPFLAQRVGHCDQQTSLAVSSGPMGKDDAVSRRAVRRVKEARHRATGETARRKAYFSKLSTGERPLVVLPHGSLKETRLLT